MKSFNVSRLPTMITLGYDGENNWRPNRFDCSSLLANHPNGVITLWLLPEGESQAFPVALERDGNTIIWTPLSEEMTERSGALQIVCMDGTDVGKSAVVLFRVDESILPGADHPAAVPSWATQTIERAEAAADRAEEAAESIDVEHLEQTIAAAVEEYLEEHPVEAPVQSVNGQTGAVDLDASDVGALPADTPIPAAVTEQTVSGWGFTKNTGDYSKPSGGIPKTDLASDVQTSLGKADTAYQKPSGGIPTSDLADDMPFFELPSGGQSGQALLSDGSNGAYWGQAQGGGTGLTDDAKQALLDCFENVAWINDDGQTYYDALYAALYPPADLVAISAVFNQGSAVIYDTDSLDTLRQYLTVTAHMSDSTTRTVTAYALSGTLMVGTNTIRVSYGGKTTTFNVTVSHNDLPAEYRKVEYIGATGTQYILTGLTGVDNFSKLEFICQIKWNDVTNRQLFGADGRKFWGVVNSYYQVGQVGTTATSVSAITGRFDDVDIELDIANQTASATINGTTVTVNDYAPMQGNASDLALFAMSLTNGVGYKAKCSIKGMKIKVNGVLERDYIPCYRKSDNVIGMYDTITETFFTNSGTGTFTKGSDA